MKHLVINKLDKQVNSAELIPEILDQANVNFHQIDIANWKEFPYVPKVKFRMAYTDKGILLNYVVNEEMTRAKYAEDGGDVWTDSCVEFFISPAGNDHYYNFECNCIGTLLLNGGKKGDRHNSSAETKKSVLRWSSLPHEAFETPKHVEEWQVALFVPYSAFFLDNVDTLEGKTVRANFYKCGDELPTPHFLSWNWIKVEKPNFHLPEFFGEVQFK